MHTFTEKILSYCIVSLDLGHISLSKAVLNMHKDFF